MRDHFWSDGERSIYQGDAWELAGELECDGLRRDHRIDNCGISV